MARQFFADHAGGSVFEDNAKRAVSGLNVQPAMRAVAHQLKEWATYEESVAATSKTFEVRFRIEAATDLLEQVQILLKDPEVHLAAPIVLAGAALEEFSRSMFEETGEPLVGKPGFRPMPRRYGSRSF